MVKMSCNLAAHQFGRSSDPIDVQLSGSSIDTLEAVAEKVKERLATYPTVYEIADSMSDGKDEMQIELTEQGLALGLNRVDVSQQVRNSFFGAQVQRIQRGRDDVRVMVSKRRLLMCTVLGRKVRLKLLMQ